jgi:DNA helicase-2/ATP-dependent DNA helicase PcrA
MTLHGAKGLEFPVVFILGLEEGIFPHYRSFFDKNGLEEERRLCYVGLTRAKQKLYLVSAEQRKLFGESWFNGPSRFLSEIPDNLITTIRSQRLSFGEDQEEPVDLEGVYNVGERIRHPKWGEGEIMGIDGSGADAIIKINFDSVGEKSLMLKYAKLSAN